MRRLAVAVLLTVPAALVLLGPASAGQRAPAATSPERVVVVGVPGLRWSDVDRERTPALWRLAQSGSVGLLSVRTAAALDCPADAWLTLGAGNRVTAGGGARACPAVLPEVELRQVSRLDRNRREGSAIAALRTALEAAGTCVSAVGAGPLLALGSQASPGLPRPRPGSCPVALREAPTVGGRAQDRSAQDADAAIAEIDRGRTPSTSMLVLGVSEPPGGRSADLHVALAVGPAFGRGALSSASTRRAPYVQLVDVAPTVLSLLSVEVPTSMIGSRWTSRGTAPDLQALRDEALKAVTVKSATVPFFVTLVGLELVLLVLAGSLRRWSVLETGALAGVVAVGASYLANAAPWWRAGHPLLTLLGAVGVVTAIVTTAAVRRRGALAPAGTACGFVAVVLVLDLLLGAHLQMSSVAGYSPLVAGRFAGIGNVAFGVLAASALLAAATTRSPTVAALTALVVVVDGAPGWGSDVGGVLALAPAYVVLVLGLRGGRIGWARLALGAAAGIAAVAVFAVADHARPLDDQTHLGRFVGRLLDGSAGALLGRKATANAELLLHSPVTALLPLVVLAAGLVLLRPPPLLAEVFDAHPSWRVGLLAVATASAVGFVVNDSGAAVPALALLVAVPATVAVLARSARLRAGAEPGA